MGEKVRKCPRRLPVLLLILYSAALAGAAFFAGRCSAPQKGLGATFYAHIVSIDGTSVRVEGLDINDINSRRPVDFDVKDDTELVWRGTRIFLDSLDPGDLVAVTHSGGVLERSPGYLLEVYRVQLLDDKW